MSDVKADAKAIFLEALEHQTPDELHCFLDEACCSDTAVRARVEELLQAHKDAGNFLGGPHPLDAKQDEPVAEGPGTVIGPYKLLEQIGEGGMGLVFMAEQTRPVRRRVALKVIKPGMDTRQVVVRFEAERQALALMDHPNIAKVHDAGTTAEGRPYFVMELVKGTPITEYCDQHRLTTRQRLALFRHVCQAVQHAHQKGIIHRDLKPSNVLVSLHDTTPIVKVIDFGIAKATGGRLTEHTVYTAFAQMLGTPLYMSPEQAGLSDLDVDTRADLYSLGVLLDELLTGMTPFDSETLNKAGYDEMRRIIREDEPPRPSGRLSTLAQAHLSTIAERRGLEPRRLSQQLRGELDWIVMKALEKDRNRRYESASELAADVQRYLDDEAVLACPPTMRYRAGKFARKHWIGLTLAGAFATLLVGGVAALAITLVVVSHAKSKAQAALVAERRAQTQTRDLLGYSAHAIGSLVSKQQSVTGQTAVLRDLLTKYQNVAADWTLSTEDRQLVTEGRDLAAAGQSNVALIREFLGELAAAETGYRKAVESYLAMAAEAPGEVRFRTELADTYNKLALVLWHENKL